MGRNEYFQFSVCRRKIEVKFEYFLLLSPLLLAVSYFYLCDLLIIMSLIILSILSYLLVSRIHQKVFPSYIKHGLVSEVLYPKKKQPLLLHPVRF